MASRYTQMKNYHLKIWTDERPTIDCRPCGNDKLTLEGRHWCPTSLSPAYWWRHGGCPFKRNKPQMTEPIGFKELKERLSEVHL